VEDFYLHEGNFLAPSTLSLTLKYEYDIELSNKDQKYQMTPYPKMDNIFLANADPAEPGMTFR
jgi:hypothetical protein